MSKPEQDRLNALRELEELLTEMSLGELSSQQRVRLNEMLLADAELRKAAQAWLCSDLLIKRALLVEESEERLGGDETLCEAGDYPTDPSALLPMAVRSCQPEHMDCAPASRLGGPATRKRSWVVSCIRAAVLILVGSGLTLALYPPSREPPEQDVAVFAEHGTPELVAMTACVWGSSDDAVPSLDRPLAVGDVLELREGIAEFELREPGGALATVRVEGPASVFVRSDGLLGLRSGALTADVHWRGDSFAIDTPAGRVSVPMGGAIGVIADGSENEVHVFDGQAIVTADWLGSGGPVAMLDAGEAASFTSRSQSNVLVDRFEASRTAFAWTQSMAFDQLILDDSYRDAVLASRPAVYWRFEERSRLVANEGLEPGLDAELNGYLSHRRFGSNRVVEFGLTPTPGYIVTRDVWPRQPVDSYTVELWVKPSHAHRGMLISLVGDRLPSGQHPHSFFIEMGTEHIYGSPTETPYSFRVVHRSPPAVAHGTSFHSKALYTVREWLHLVMRKQGPTIQLFLNGELVAEERDESPLPAGMRVALGQLYPGTPIRLFAGQVDEVALYERALTDKEIVHHYGLRGDAREIERDTDTETDIDTASSI